MQKFKNYFFLLLLILAVSSCSDETTEESPILNDYLVELTDKGQFELAQVQGLVQSLYGQNVASILTKGYKSYKLTYKSTYEGDEVVLSGILSVPSDATRTAYPLLLSQRGTITKDTEAPSISGLPIYEIFACAEYITFTPDLIGFGESSDILHPYFDYNYTATASLDMYRAVLEAIEEIGVQKTDQFYITGYSQGGYSALTTHKYIQENVSDIVVTATAAGAGGYDLKTLVANIVEEDTFPSPILLAMPVITYNNLYIKGELTEFFNEPYASTLPNLIGGEYSVGEINAQLTTNLETLFNQDFLEKLRNDEETVLESAFQANSVHDWLPTAPITFYHHENDEIIAVESTTSTMNQMRDAGATVSYVELITLTPEVSEQESVHANAAIYSFAESLKNLKQSVTN